MARDDNWNRRSCQLALCLITGLLSNVATEPHVAYGEKAQIAQEESSIANDEEAASFARDKQELEAYLRKQVQELELQMEALREKGTDLRESTKSQFNEKLERLKEQKDLLTLKMDDLKHSSEKTWNKIKDGILKTIAQLHESVSGAENPE